MSNCLVPLPSSVEDMLIRICVEQSHPPLDTIARQKLASLGEEASLKLLREIRQERNIEDLNKFVTFIAAKLSSNPLGILSEYICFLIKTIRSTLLHFCK